MFKRIKQASEFQRLFPASDYYPLPHMQKQMFHAWRDAGCPGEELVGKGRVPGMNTDLLSVFYRDAERINKASEVAYRRRVEERVARVTPEEARQWLRRWDEAASKEKLADDEFERAMRSRLEEIAGLTTKKSSVVVSEPKPPVVKKTTVDREVAERRRQDWLWRQVVTEEDFRAAEKELGCDHPHEIHFSRGYAHAAPPYDCVAWSRLIQRQRENRRAHNKQSRS